MNFDKWFAETFPQLMSGIEPLEPFYSIASIAYEKALNEDRDKIIEWRDATKVVPVPRNLGIDSKSKTVSVVTKGYGNYMGYYCFAQKKWFCDYNDVEIPDVYAWYEFPIPPKEMSNES